jgi:hypothetical protein
MQCWAGADDHILNKLRKTDKLRKQTPQRF